jgi:hypothetical protein
MNSSVAMSTVQANKIPKNIFLFSGHMIDGANRQNPRFPPDKESVAAAAIANTLAEIGTERGDLAICGGECGGDLLFAEVHGP